MATTAYRTSVELAKEKGSFPFLTGETTEETNRLRQAFIETGYMKKMPEDIRQSILENGIRNSHLLTVAPTGSHWYNGRSFNRIRTLLLLLVLQKWKIR